MNTALAERVNGPRAVAALFADALRRRYGDAVVQAKLFGSCARGEAHERSDVDVAVAARPEEGLDGEDGEAV